MENNRKHVYRMIIAKNPKAIMRIKSIKKSWTCKCKNSNCQKNYCDCYQNGKFCSSKCKCIDCKNKNKLKKNNKRCNKKNPVINRSKSKKNTINEIPIEAMYTPQKKNYRTVKSTTANKMLSTAYTDISLPNPLPIDRTQSKPSSTFKPVFAEILGASCASIPITSSISSITRSGSALGRSTLLITGMTSRS